MNKYIVTDIDTLSTDMRFYQPLENGIIYARIFKLMCMANFIVATVPALTIIKNRYQEQDDDNKALNKIMSFSNSPKITLQELRKLYADV